MHQSVVLQQLPRLDANIPETLLPDGYLSAQADCLPWCAVCLVRTFASSNYVRGASGFGRGR